MKMPMTQSKLIFLDFSNEDFWKFPDSFIKKLNIKNYTHITDPLKLKDSFETTETIITLPIAIPGLKRFKKLKNIIVLGSGVPSSFLDLGEKVNIISAKGINASSVASHALYFAFKGVRESSQLRDPSNLSLGIIGSGHVAKNLKTKGSHLFREINLLGRNESCEFSISNASDKESFAKLSDVIIFCIDSNTETQKIVDKDFLRATKDNVIYVNVSRGDLFCEQLMIDDLSQNSKKQYFTDVTIPHDYPELGPLRLMKNAHITNHIAGTFEGVWDDLYNFVKKSLEEIS